MTPLRIAIVCYPTFGGSGVVATELAHGLALRGHEIHLVSYAAPARLESFDDRIRLHEVEVSSYPLFRYPPYEVALASRLADVAEEAAIDLVHVHYAIPHTLAALLDSKTRPRQWTRSFSSTDYDQTAVGWKFTVAVPHAMEPDEMKRTKIYDTTKFGYGNQGHTFGDALEPEERTAVLEYLKTL